MYKIAEIKTGWEQKPADRNFSATSERMWERIAKIEAIFRQTGAHQSVHGSVKYLVSQIARLDRLNERKTKQMLAQAEGIARLKAAIEAAPHDEDYPCNSFKDGKRHPCMCWKSKIDTTPPRGTAHV